MKETIFTTLMLLLLININAQQWSSIIPNNIAQFKPTKQSSIFNAAHSNKAVDGNLDGNYNNRSVTHTELEEGPGGTGNKVKVSGFEFWRLDKNGLIKKSQGHFPTEEYNRQIEFGIEK